MHVSLTACRDDNGRTPLHWAAQLDFTEASQALLASADAKRQLLRQEAAAAAAEAAAAATAAAGAGAPAAAAAPQEEDEDAVPPPLVVFQDKQGCTALHLAARQGHVRSVQQLLAAVGEGEGAAAALCKTKNKAGQNALHLAATVGCAACAAMLAEVAPDAAAAKSKLGLTPADVAARRRHAELAAALREGKVAEHLAALPKGQGPPAGPMQRTLLVAPPECLFHHTCPAPITR
jgi:ankyrin repeat protein